MEENVIIYHKPIIDGRIMWISSAVNNGLYTINVDTGACLFIGLFPKEEFDTRYLHTASAMYRNKIFFIPFAGRYITSYDKATGKMESYKLNHYSDTTSSLFFTSVQSEQMLYLIPCRYEYLVQLNMENGELIEFRLFEHQENFRGEEAPFVLKGGCLGDGCIYIGSNTKNMVIQFDLVTHRIQRRNIPYELFGISNLEYENNKLWIIGKNGRIVCWDLKGNTFEVLDDLLIEGLNHYGYIFETLKYKNHLFMSESYERMLFDLDMGKKEVKRISFEQMPIANSDFCPVDMFAMYLVDEEIRLLDSFSGETYRYSIMLRSVSGDRIAPITENDIEYGDIINDDISIEVALKKIRLISFIDWINEGQYDFNNIYDIESGNSLVLHE
jgi:hypothetical protein